MNLAGDVESFKPRLSALLKELDAQENEESKQDEIKGTLYEISSSYTKQIIDDLANSQGLERDLWSCFSVVCNHYRAKLESGGGTNESNVETMTMLYRIISKSYKEFIKRVIEVYGGSAEIQRLIPILQLDIPETQVQEPNASITERVEESIKHALCRLGDISRYKSMANSKDSPHDSKHSMVYYQAASRVTPSDGTPANQLGNLAYTNGDYFEALYWFLVSQVVSRPFQVDNVKRVTHKLSSMGPEKLIKSAKLAGAPENDVKLVVLNFVWTFCTCFEYQVNKRVSSPVSLNDINEACKRFGKLLSDRRIPSKTLIKLCLIGPMLTYVSDKRGPFKHGSDQNQVFSLTIGMFHAVRQAALHNANHPSEGALAEGMQHVLPVLRIYMDWFVKFFVHSVEWERHENTPTLAEIVAVMEPLRKEYGFKFDPLTAVGLLSGQSSDNPLLEERLCKALMPFNGGLNDTPSGLSREAHADNNVAIFQCQCILFSAIELSRLDFTKLEFDYGAQAFVIDRRSDKVDGVNHNDDDDEVVYQPRKRFTNKS